MSIVDLKKYAWLILGLSSFSVAIEMPSAFEHTAFEEAKSIAELFKIFPKEILDIIIHFSSLSGKSPFLNELARQVELADTSYNTIIQAYLSTLEYFPTEEDIPTLLEHNFKTTTLDKTEFQSKIKAALQKYIASFAQISKHIKNKDEKSALYCFTLEKCAHPYLDKIASLRSMSQRQLNKHLCKLSLDKKNRIIDEKSKIEETLFVTIKLIRSCRRIIHASNNYTLFNKLHNFLDFLFPSFAFTSLGTFASALCVKTISYYRGNEELSDNFLALIRPLGALAFLGTIAILVTQRACDNRALLTFDRWLEGELKVLNELQKRIQQQT
jgi:hypothetical protein